jgi:hypothetical protein
MIYMDQIQSTSELIQILHSFIDGGWLVLIVGTAGMIARLALFSGKVTLIHCIKNLIAAMFCSCVTWFVLEEIKMHFMYKAIIYTLAGLDAPELIKGTLKIAQGFAQDPHSFLVQLKKGKLNEIKKYKSADIRTNRISHRRRN